jgi:hypothetical protein
MPSYASSEPSDVPGIQKVHVVNLDYELSWALLV